MNRFFVFAPLALSACAGPDIVILSPEHGAQIELIEGTTFEGLVDPGMGELSGLEVRWESDLDGLLGTSEPDLDGNVSLSTRDLGVGWHTVTATVTDEKGRGASAEIGLDVTSEWPVVRFLQPVEEEVVMKAGERLVVIVEAYDAQDPPDALFVYAELGRQRCDMTLNDDYTGICSFTPQGGLYELTARARDSDGHMSRLSVRVAAEGNASPPGIEEEEVDEDLDGFLASQGDCDDEDADVHPGAPETCDGVDEDCDGQIDEDVGPVWYEDGDDDGFGDGPGVRACAQPPGFVSEDGDCDDGDDQAHPGASETCNGADDDCDGYVDEGAGTHWYRDGDGDGYGTDAVPGTTACSQPIGYSDRSDDCYDDNPNVHPGSSTLGATHRGDGSYDYDCDGLETKTWPSMATWSCSGTGGIHWANGWEGIRPDCGEVGVWATGCDYEALLVGTTLLYDINGPDDTELLLQTCR